MKFLKFLSKAAKYALAIFTGYEIHTDFQAKDDGSKPIVPFNPTIVVRGPVVPEGGIGALNTKTLLLIILGILTATLVAGICGKTYSAIRRGAAKKYQPEP